MKKEHVFFFFYQTPNSCRMNQTNRPFRSPSIFSSYAWQCTDPS